MCILEFCEISSEAMSVPACDLTCAELCDCVISLCTRGSLGRKLCISQYIKLAESESLSYLVNGVQILADYAVRFMFLQGYPIVW